ncbi:hypothetical protein [Leptolyngbya phage Lbo-JY46]
MYTTKKFNYGMEGGVWLNYKFAIDALQAVGDYAENKNLSIVHIEKINQCFVVLFKNNDLKLKNN